MRIISLLLVVIISLTCNNTSNAQKAEDPVSRTYFVNSKTEFNNIRTIAVFLNGEGKELQHVLQDALTIKFKSYNWHVIDREQLQAEVARDYQTKQKQALKDSAFVIAPLSVEQMAGIVKSQHFMIIDYAVGKKQYSYPVSKSGTEVTDKIVIINLSFRILKVGDPVPVAIGVLDFLLGQSPSYAADDIKLLIDKMKVL